MDKKKSFIHYGLLGLVLLFAFVFLPSTSFLYSDFVESMTHDYFNFAKSMLYGKILYTDLYDHKGIVLFLLYYIPVLISNTSMIGVFVVEGVVSIALVLSCYYYCANKYSENTGLLITAITVLTAFFAFRQTMLNTEPLCLIIVFLLLRYIDTKQYETYKIGDYILFGIAFSCIFWMKYPLIITLFPFWLYICIQSIKNHKVGIFVRRCFCSFLCFAGVSVSILIYLHYNNALSSMFNIYFGSTVGQTFAFLGTYTEVVAICLFIPVLLWCILKGKSNKRNLFFVFWFIAITLLNNIGGMRNYSACFMLLFIPLCIPDLFQYKYARPIVTGIFVLITLLLLPTKLNCNYERNCKDIAGEYGLSNNNVLYLSEDIGFGSYSEEPFREPRQWLPGRITYSTNDEFYDDTLNWLKEKEFQYICVQQEHFDYSISQEDIDADRYAEIINVAQKNYEIVEAISIGSARYYLCVSK